MDNDQYRIRIAFSRSSIIGGAIRFFTGGDVNHAFILYYDPVFATTVALGANSNGFTPQRLASFGGAIVRVYESADIDLLIGLRAGVADGMLDEAYDYAALVGMAAVEVEAHLANRIVKNPGLTRHHLFCSEAVAKIIRSSRFVELDQTTAMAVLPNVPAGSIDPYTLDRALAVSPYFRIDTRWNN